MKGFVDRLTLGITRILESRPGVTVVKFVQKEPAERHVILSWELPLPLGSMVINSVCALSPLCESALYSLPSAPTLADLDSESDSGGVESQPEKPHFDSEIGYLSWTPAMEMEVSASFTETPNHIVIVITHKSVISVSVPPGCSMTVSVRVCIPLSPELVAQQCEVWFLDCALYWHFLTESSTAYCRLMVTHLGLPE
ncbi:tubulin polyglutamylase complex subunit 2-like isoform X2 [Polyodon spathula]|uniref:tubulin polyglutamylase complex subunit 2-like isoform X2 n=1 Tax=Polyodon spathula TaxID=7913 RepID=UPI001B7F3638|nr:tubulin polyglutamylase complex subunit 2-like isoform X2 [Polyodon spathula]